MRKRFSMKRMVSMVIAMLLAMVLLVPATSENAYAASKKTTVDATYEIKVGETVTINVSGDSIKWKSSDKKIATVSKSGVVTGKKEGTAVVTATITNKVKAKPAKTIIGRIIQLLFPKKTVTIKSYQVNVVNSTEPTEPTDPTEPTEPTDPTDPTDPIEPERPVKPENPSEVDNYYWDNSKEVVAVINAKESEDVQSEKEALEIFASRGFEDCDVFYSFEIDGTYCGNTDAETESENKHPIYQAYYLTENGDVWTLYTINGKLMAYPTSFNYESELEAEVIFSETAEITSYDPESNQFYVTVPMDTAAIIKIVDRIDAETLDKLTIEEIKNYE